MSIPSVNLSKEHYYGSILQSREALIGGFEFLYVSAGSNDQVLCFFPIFGAVKSKLS